jgi:hypothetical protein
MLQTGLLKVIIFSNFKSIILNNSLPVQEIRIYRLLHEVFCFHLRKLYLHFTKYSLKIRLLFSFD